MESRFGHDFAQVRVHADTEADELARGLHARALTVNGDVYFRDGAFAPDQATGAHLLAHELAHVAQRAGAGAGRDAVGHDSDAAETAAWDAADAALTGAPVAVGDAAPATVSCAPEEKAEGDSIFSTMGDLVKFPKDVANVLPGLDPISSTLGGLGGFDKAMRADNAVDATSGLLGTGAGIAGLTSWMGEDTLGKATSGTIGGVGGLLSAGSSALDAYSDFSKGNYGKGALDVTKTAASAGSGLAQIGGFELAEAGEMGAGEALFGGGGEGLAALGPAGAVLGAGLAGAGVGTMLYEHTSVKEHSDETLGGLDAMLTGEGERPWSLRTQEAMGEDWDKGNYLSSIGNGAELAGFATLGALGGIGGGVVDAGKWVGGHAADAASAVGGGISDAASWVGGGISDAASSLFSSPDIFSDEGRAALLKQYGS